MLSQSGGQKTEIQVLAVSCSCEGSSEGSILASSKFCWLLAIHFPDFRCLPLTSASIFIYAVSVFSRLLVRIAAIGLGPSSNYCKGPISK